MSGKNAVLDRLKWAFVQWGDEVKWACYWCHKRIDAAPGQDTPECCGHTMMWTATRLEQIL